MKHVKYIGLLLVGVSLMGMSGGRNRRNAQNARAGDPTPAPVTVSTPCPTALTADGLTQWRNSAIDSYGSSVSESGVNSWIHSCFPEQNQVPACVNRISAYINRNAGSNNRDPDYRTDPHRRLPDELLVSGSDTFQYVLRGDIEAHAKELGWPVARYKSRHSGGFDSETPNLIMIEVPGSMLNPPVNFDRYINIAIVKDDHDDGNTPTPQTNFPDPAALAASDNGRYPHITTMVTVERGTREHKAELYYQMFNRSGNVYSPSAPNNPLESSCVRCHPSGLRAISPLGYHVRAGENQLDPANWAQVKRINSDMAAGQRGGIMWTAPTDSEGRPYPVIDTKAFGPIVGPSEPFSQNTRTKEFIVGADGTSGCQSLRSHVSVTDIFGRPPGRNNNYSFTSSPPVDWQKVADAMDCEMCHNNEKQGVINSLTSWDEIDFKILVDQSMPNGAHKNPLDQGSDPATPVVDDLNLNERLALANCLKAEYDLERTKVKDWLKAVPCAPAVAKNTKHGTATRLPANTKKKKAVKKKAVKKKVAPAKAVVKDPHS
jgi:hypothetical protein